MKRKKEVALKNILNAIKILKEGGVNPSEIYIHPHDLKYLKKRTFEYYNWDLIPNKLFGLKIISLYDLKVGEIRIK